MRQIDTSLAILGLVLGLGGGAAHAADAVPAVYRVEHGASGWRQVRAEGDERRAHADKLFERFDADGDGRVTREEVDAAHAARRAERLEKYDADKDGRIGAAEFEAMWLDRAREQAKRAFERMDANGDGVIGEDEEQGGRSAWMFEHLDADGDGAITREEIEKVRLERHGGHGRQGRRGDRADHERTSSL